MKEKLKEKWDEIHPEYSFLTDKNLRDQASPIEKNKDVMDTEYVHFRSNNNAQFDEQTYYSNNCSETVNNSNCGSYEESQPTLEPLIIMQQKHIQSIEPLFESNYVNIDRKFINERTFTKIMKHPSDDVLKVIDQLAKRKLSQIENPHYLDINVLLYTPAVTTKEYLSDSNEKYTETNPKVKMPQWITNIEEKILRLKYGNTKLQILKFQITVLKHNLCATSVKLKYQKRGYNRKLINRKFSTNLKAVYHDFIGNNISTAELPT